MGVNRAENNRTLTSQVITVEPAKTKDNEEEPLRALIITHRSQMQTTIWEQAFKKKYRGIIIDRVILDSEPAKIAEQAAKQAAKKAATPEAKQAAKQAVEQAAAKAAKQAADIKSIQSLIKKNKYHSFLLEANAGDQGTNTPTPICFIAMNGVVKKNPNVHALLVTGTTKCAEVVLNNPKYKSINMDYIEPNMTVFNNGEQILFGHKQYPTLASCLDPSQQLTVSSDTLAESMSPVSQSTLSPPDSPAKSKPSVSYLRSLGKKLKSTLLCYKEPNQTNLGQEVGPDFTDIIGAGGDLDKKDTTVQDDESMVRSYGSRSQDNNSNRH